MQLFELEYAHFSYWWCLRPSVIQFLSILVGMQSIVMMVCTIELFLSI